MLQNLIIMNLKDIRMKIAFYYLGHLSNVMLSVALGLGLYTEWVNSENMAILLMALCGLLVFGLSCTLQYYLNKVTLGQSLLHLWLGCILGVIIFTDEQEYRYETLEESMDILLVSSAAFSIFWAVCERITHTKKVEASLFSTMQALECSGLIVASLVVGTIDSIVISLCVIAFLFNLTAIRLKSLLSLFSFAIFMLLVTFMILPSLPVKANMYGLICFAGRNSFEPIIDLYFSGFTTLERWQAFFSKSGILRKITVILIFFINLTFAGLTGHQSTGHKEWFVVVPLYVGFVLLWLCFHVIFLITSWILMNKVSECNLTFLSLSDNHRSMTRIMASKGLRHFGLISQRLTLLALVTSLLLFGVGWETRTAYSVGLFLVVLPLEMASLSLFRELGDNLGGTCIGYALVAPNTGNRTNGSVKLLSSSGVEDIGTRAMTTLNKMQQFFSRNMIDNYGCDFMSSGVSEEYLRSKVCQFFTRKTSDGPRYDTYMLYYSGDCLETGDWALTDNCSVKLETLLEWWSEKNADSGSRLILVCDTLHSWCWAQQVSRLDQYVAIQVWRYRRSPDPELGQNVGAFTDDWVRFNMDEELDVPWTDKERNIQAVYKVSTTWTDFSFHLPTREDMESHWNSNFPAFTKPLIRSLSVFQYSRLCCCCEGVRNCLRRKRMQWLPPKVADTGHGFKLVRS
ncbi:TM168-like protein [Mya arenaria]|uniref:Transmembrane protein 168 n=1 Tax=Mya arenaria TaxID=6604 RepID=A0ABY7FTA7_MYAAR|nr:TM168-like protein [Mya arenaria]